MRQEERRSSLLFHHPTVCHWVGTRLHLCNKGTPNSASLLQPRSATRTPRHSWYNAVHSARKRERVKPDNSTTTYRTNDQWVADLRGENGQSTQESAYKDLGRYIWVCAFNLLKRKAPTSPGLSSRTMLELSEYANDFTQMVLLKVSEDQHALLDKFRSEGKFVHWIATITNRLVLDQIRLINAKKEIRLTKASDSLEGGNNDPLDAVRWNQDWLLGGRIREPEEDLARRDLAAALANCIDQLPERQRKAYMSYAVNGRSGNDIASDLETTRNAVFQLVYAARRALRACLRKGGYR